MSKDDETIDLMDLVRQMPPADEVATNMILSVRIGHTSDNKVIIDFLGTSLVHAREKRSTRLRVFDQALRRKAGGNALKFISNIEKSRKAAVLEAARITGANIVWRDEPDEKMDNYRDRKNYGSVWTTDHDLSAFWAVYRRILDGQ